MDQTRIYIDDHTALIAGWGRIVAVRWRAAPSVEHIHHLRDALIGRATDKRDKVACISLLAGGLGVPEKEGQEAFRDLVKASGDHLCAHGIVLAIPGVTGMLIRSLVRTTGVIMRPPYPQTIFATEDAVAPWAAEQLGDVDPESVLGWLGNVGRATAA